MKKIVIVTHTTGLGGLEVRIANMIKVFLENKEVMIYLLTNGAVYFQKRLKENDQLTILQTDLGDASNFYHRLKHIQPWRIIFMESEIMNIQTRIYLSGVLCTRGNVILTEHSWIRRNIFKSYNKNMSLRGNLSMYVRFYMNIFFKNLFSKKIYTTSSAVRTYLEDWGFSKKKLALLPTSLALDNFQPDAEKRNKFRCLHNINKDDFVIINVARFAPIKRIDKFINIYNIFSQRYNNFWAILAGDGHLRDNLLDMVQTKEKFLYLGEISHVELAEALNAADVFVFTSEREGLGLALIEAMSAGVIPVSTDSGGPRDIIDCQLNGFIAKNDEDLADYINMLYGMNTKDKYKLKLNAIKKANGFDIKHGTSKLLELIN